MNVAEDLLREMNGLIYRGTAFSELLRDVRQDVEEFELEKTAEKVKTLIDRSGQADTVMLAERKG